jgi:hypothetical protein
MNLQETKMELIEMLINTQKTTVLEKIKSILEAERPTITFKDYEIIDSRREQHLAGQSKSYSWEQAKQAIRNS